MIVDEPWSKLTAALAAAHAEIRRAVKSGENPHFNSKFAPLPEVISVVRDACSQHGLFFIQRTDSAFAETERTVSVRTDIIHKDGGVLIGDWLTMPLQKGTAQDVGSGITYARRYSLAAMFGVADTEDDDGNTASDPFTSKAARTKAWNAVKAAASDEDADKAKEVWRALSNEQQLAIWDDLGKQSGIRSKLKELLK